MADDPWYEVGTEEPDCGDDEELLDIIYASENLTKDAKKLSECARDWAEKLRKEAVQRQESSERAIVSQQQMFENMKLEIVQLKEQLRESQMKRRPSRSRSEIVCWNCWESGHFASQCKNPKKPKPEDFQGMGPRRRQKTELAETTDSEGNTELLTELSDELAKMRREPKEQDQNDEINKQVLVIKEVRDRGKYRRSMASVEQGQVRRHADGPLIQQVIQCSPRRQENIIKKKGSSSSPKSH